MPCYEYHYHHVSDSDAAFSQAKFRLDRLKST